MKIDTGLTHSNESAIRRACFSSELDGMPENATDAQVADYVAQYLIGRIRKYKSARVMRQHLISRWELVRMIADHHPDVFDAILMEYAEHATEIT